MFSLETLVFDTKKLNASLQSLSVYTCIYIYIYILTFLSMGIDLLAQ